MVLVAVTAADAATLVESAAIVDFSRPLAVVALWVRGRDVSPQVAPAVTFSAVRTAVETCAVIFVILLHQLGVV